MKKSGAQYAIAIVCVILGVVLALQFKNVQRVGGNVSLWRSQELTNEISKIETENKALKKQIENYENKIAEFENAVKDEGASNKVLYEQLTESRILAGLIDLKGSGIEVVLDVLYYEDEFGTRKLSNIHYEDLLKLVNELNSAGAEAISINGERLIATTEIRNAGDFIVINTNRYAAPFTVKAIGDSKQLEASLNMFGGIAEYLAEHLDVRITKKDSITIEKYDSPIEYYYTQPVNMDDSE